MNREKEKTMIRRLAEQVAAIAHLPVQQKKIDKWKKLNSLNMERPMVLTYNFPWSEGESAIDELKIHSEDEFHRKVECYLRRLLFKWNHIRGDMVIEPVFLSPIYINDTGLGFAFVGGGNASGGKGISLCANIHTFDKGSPQSAMEYKPLLKDEDDLKKIKDPVISIDHEKTEEEYMRYSELLEPALIVEKCGAQTMSFQPMDVLARLWGITELMMDMTARPKLIHAAMARLVDAYLARLEQLERLNILSLNSLSPGTITQGMGESYTDELPGCDYDPSHIKPHNMWGGAAAQILSCVSPAMHDEFSLTYEEKWLHRFGLTSYGCCEPLHQKVGILKKIKNLRKISISSWVDIGHAVESIGNKYVFSYKPKPVFLAMDHYDLSSSKKEIEAVLSKCQEYDCQVELILRTIISYRSDIKRLSEWVAMAMSMVGAHE